VALKGNGTNFCSGWWRGNSEPETFCIHWKNFLINFWILNFHTQWFLAKRTMWDSVLVIWPFVAFHVMKLNMSKEFNCIFLQDFNRCDESSSMAKRESVYKLKVRVLWNLWNSKNLIMMCRQDFLFLFLHMYLLIF
jgi:hypothetical protein